MVNVERIESLLEEYLGNGRIPAEATEEEAAELTALGQLAGELRSVASVSSGEAAISFDIRPRRIAENFPIGRVGRPQTGQPPSAVSSW